MPNKTLHSDTLRVPVNSVLDGVINLALKYGEERFKMENRGRTIGISLTVGIVLGAVVGSIAGNVGLWIAMGVVLGIVVGVVVSTVLTSRAAEDNNDSRPENPPSDASEQ